MTAEELLEEVLAGGGSIVPGDPPRLRAPRWLIPQIEERRPELRALVEGRVRQPLRCPLCGNSVRHFIVAGTDMFACYGGCPGARIASRLGYHVPGCGPLYEAALEQAEQRARQGEAVGLVS